jgi:hypothetical protein
LSSCQLHLSHLFTSVTLPLNDPIYKHIKIPYKIRSISKLALKKNNKKSNFHFIFCSLWLLIVCKLLCSVFFLLIFFLLPKSKFSICRYVINLFNFFLWASSQPVNFFFLQQPIIVRFFVVVVVGLYHFILGLIIYSKYELYIIFFVIFKL